MAAQSLGLHEIYQQAKALAYGIWRKRWYMLITAWAIAIVGWGAIYNMPYRYEANARIFVDADSLLPQLIRSNGLKIDSAKKIEAVRKEIVSRPNLEKIIRRSEYLERLAQNSGERNNLITRMQRNIRVVALEGNNFQIAYEVDESRLSDRQRAEVAKTVVSNLLAFFREGTGENSGAAIKTAADFLDERINDLSDRLNSADAAHTKFKQDNVEFLGSINFATRLETARSDLKETRSEMAELRVTQQTFEKQLESIPQTLNSAASDTARGGDKDPLDERINEIKKKLDQLRTLGYKDRHPDVVNVMRQLEALNVEKKQQIKDLEAALSGAAETGKQSSLVTTRPNRLYEQIMLENISILGQIRALEQREIEQNLVVDELQAKAQRVPEIEAEESQLKRGYDTLRGQHRKLLKQKADIDIQQSISTSSSAVTFRVIEPPVTPQRPSGPPRMLFMSAVLVGALVAGFGVSLVLSQLKPVVVTVEQLRTHFDLPVLGNITRAMSEVESKQRNKEMLGFAGATVALFMIFTIFIVLDIIGSPTVG